METEKILVTGVNSVAGEKLVDSLLGQYAQHQLLLTDIHQQTKKSRPTLQYIRSSTVREADLSEAIKNNGVSVVYHVVNDHLPANFSDPVASWNHRMKSLLAMLAIARDCEVKKLYCLLVNTGERDKIAAGSKSPSVGEMVNVAGTLWCAYYKRRYGMQIIVLS